ncbi:MAG: hypothetical protein HQK51_14920, partial [Oligoflexia bacterium]|nr:hypothetical protein [Oligoflexia bacterium]
KIKDVPLLESILGEDYNFYIQNSVLFMVAYDVVKTLSKDKVDVGKSLLPIRIYREIDHLFMRYVQLRCHFIERNNSLKSDYSFFVFKKQKKRIENEFDLIVKNILSAPENAHFLTM